MVEEVEEGVEVGSGGHRKGWDRDDTQACYDGGGGGCRAMLYGQHRRMPHGTCHMRGSATRTAPTGAMIFLFYQR